MLLHDLDAAIQVVQSDLTTREFILIPRILEHAAMQWSNTSLGSQHLPIPGLQCWLMIMERNPDLHHQNEPESCPFAAVQAVVRVVVPVGVAPLLVRHDAAFDYHRSAMGGGPMNISFHQSSPSSCSRLG